MPFLDVIERRQGDWPTLTPIHVYRKFLYEVDFTFAFCSNILVISCIIAAVHRPSGRICSYVLRFSHAAVVGDC